MYSTYGLKSEQQFQLVFPTGFLSEIFRCLSTPSSCTHCPPSRESPPKLKDGYGCYSTRPESGLRLRLLLYLLLGPKISPAPRPRSAVPKSPPPHNWPAASERVNGVIASPVGRKTISFAPSAFPSRRCDRECGTTDGVWLSDADGLSNLSRNSSERAP
jgi:hypothetical protein